MANFVQLMADMSHIPRMLLVSERSILAPSYVFLALTLAMSGVLFVADLKREDTCLIHEENKSGGWLTIEALQVEIPTGNHGTLLLRGTLKSVM